jgi:lipoprotein-anchoring transpeptidase ErfK/SrfK
MRKLHIYTSVFAVCVSLLLALRPALAAPANAAADEPGGDEPYYSQAQQLITELVAQGETDLDQLVAVIASDNLEQLDHIVINIASQRLYECNADGQVLREAKVSTGRKGYDTPPGNYEIQNRSPKAYSQKYDAWMLHWMGLTSDGAYGMHGLEGSSYEKLLGGVASHGCVRLSRKYAKELYSRIKVGMPVKIVKDKDLKMTPYTPLTKDQATDLVLDVLSPADPDQVFF